MAIACMATKLFQEKRKATDSYKEFNPGIPCFFHEIEFPLLQGGKRLNSVAILY